MSSIENVPEHVRELFAEMTLKLVDLGFERYSARAIIHQIRWHKHVDKGDRSFKCNDHWTPYLARWFQDIHPEHAAFFETRKLGQNHQNYEFFS